MLCFQKASRAFLCKWKQKQEKNQFTEKVEMKRKMGPKGKKEQQRSLKAVEEEKVEKWEINEVVIRMDISESSSKRNYQ